MNSRRCDAQLYFFLLGKREAGKRKGVSRVLMGKDEWKAYLYLAPHPGNGQCDWVEERASEPRSILTWGGVDRRVEHWILFCFSL